MACFGGSIFGSWFWVYCWLPWPSKSSFRETWQPHGVVKIPCVWKCFINGAARYLYKAQYSCHWHFDLEYEFLGSWGLSLILSSPSKTFYSVSYKVCLLLFLIDTSWAPIVSVWRACLRGDICIETWKQRRNRAEGKSFLERGTASQGKEWGGCLWRREQGQGI